MEDLREQLMAERLIPYNIDVRYVPGKQMEAPDLAWDIPFLKKTMNCIKKEVGRSGISVWSRRDMSLDVKDPKIEILAKIASVDKAYLRNIR